ncbi:MAG: YeeE/YedE family protein [Chitinophagales bacterium]|nr:YeeE/YedE family protein [Chitinophagales bacterium]
MKMILFAIFGIAFGIIAAKAEVISWFRIYEMFRFQSFHMYGIIGSAVVLGAILIQFVKRSKMKDIDGNQIVLSDKNKSVARYLLGGTIFGLGWALSGACPGPMFILAGYGYYTILIVIVSAILGTFTYGLLRGKLPH